MFEKQFLVKWYNARYMHFANAGGMIFFSKKQYY